MKENIKTAILLLLVCSSLFLTYQLWYGLSPAQPLTEDVYERVEVESPRPLEQVVTPGRIMVVRETSTLQFRQGEEIFNNLWESLSAILQGLDNLTAVDGDLIFDSDPLSTVAAYYFRPPLPVGSDLPWLSWLAYQSVDLIEIKWFDNDYWLVLYENVNEGRLSFRISADVMEDLILVIGDLEDLDKNDYLELTDSLVTGIVESNLSVRSNLYVPQDPVYLSKIPLRPEALDRDLLLRSFFVDLNLARVIEEKEEGLIYTDGDKGLRITTMGLAYSAPRLEEGQSTISYPEALLNCSSLISYHGGWPDNLRLEDFALTGRSHGSYYSATWKKYYNEYPLLTKMPTRLSFNDRGLIHYSRSIYFPESNMGEELLEVAAWDDALKAAVRLIALTQPGSESDLRVERIQLVYAVTGSNSVPVGVPAWQLIINGENIVLEAHTLEQIHGEDLL